MPEKIIPKVGNFTIIVTSVQPHEVGYVYERTSKEIGVRFKNGRIGKYSIASNEFEEFSSGTWEGNPSLEEKIEAIQEVYDWLEAESIKEEWKDNIS